MPYDIPSQDTWTQFPQRVQDLLAQIQQHGQGQIDMEHLHAIGQALHQRIKSLNAPLDWAQPHPSGIKPQVQPPMGQAGGGGREPRNVPLMGSGSPNLDAFGSMARGGG